MGILFSPSLELSQVLLGCVGHVFSGGRVWLADEGLLSRGGLVLGPHVMAHHHQEE
jgi:hypothetical protein